MRYRNLAALLAMLVLVLAFAGLGMAEYSVELRGGGGVDAAPLGETMVVTAASLTLEGDAQTQPVVVTQGVTPEEGGVSFPEFSWQSGSERAVYSFTVSNRSAVDLTFRALELPAEAGLHVRGVTPLVGDALRAGQSAEFSFVLSRAEAERVSALRIGVRYDLSQPENIPQPTYTMMQNG